MRGILRRPIMRFSGGHAKPYDWRIDPNYNTMLPDHYSTSYKPNIISSIPYLNKRPDPLASDVPAEFDLYNPKHKLNVNYIKPRFETKGGAIPIYDLNDDIPHEADYESEDYDFYVESWKAQHYKKDGIMWLHLLVVMLYPIYWWYEYMWNKVPDQEYWKRPMPPPLEYNDEMPDVARWMHVANSNHGKMLVDEGALKPIEFDIINGKKVFKKYIQLNQPITPEELNVQA